MNIHDLLFFLAAILFGFLWIWGVHCAMTMIFRKVAAKIDSWLTEYITWNSKFTRIVLKPLFLCPPCMSSVHGFFLFFLLFHGWPAYHVIAYIIVLAGLNFIVKEALYPDNE